MSSKRGRSHGLVPWRLGAVFVALGVLLESQARASPAHERDDLERARRVVDDEARRVDTGWYAHFYGSVSVGRGVRTNNPYRLERVLGKSAKGLSLSALYMDVAGGWLMGNPTGIEHGPSANMSVALTGIRQEVLTPGYRALVRLDPHWAASARLGVPIVLEPDLSTGIEVGAAGLFRVLAGVAAYAELIGSAFLGAATYQVDTTIIPIISLELGLWIDYEVLP